MVDRRLSVLVTKHKRHSCKPEGLRLLVDGHKEKRAQAKSSRGVQNCGFRLVTSPVLTMGLP